MANQRKFIPFGGMLDLFELRSKTNPRMNYRTSESNIDIDVPEFRPSMKNVNFYIDKKESATYKILSDTFKDPSLFVGVVEDDVIDITPILKKQGENTASESYNKRNLLELRPISRYDNVFYPKKSRLNNIQQLICFKALKLVTSPNQNPTLEDMENFRIFNSLVKLREAEYEEFARFVEELWFSSNNIRHLHIQNDLHLYIKEYWRARFHRVKYYPQFYSTAASIPLENSTENSPCLKITLKHEKELHRQGELSKLVIPTKNEDVFLTTCDELLEKKQVHFKDNSAAHTMPVSMDPTAITLAAENCADIVISSSSLKMLIDNGNPSTNDWIIPIVVKDVCVIKDKNRVIKRVVYVDKALPPEKRTTKERNEWVHKVILKDTFKKFSKEVTPIITDKPSIDTCSKNVEISENVETKTTDVISSKSETDLNIQTSLPKFTEEQLININQSLSSSTNTNRVFGSDTDSDSDSLHIVCDEDIAPKRCTRSMTRNNSSLSTSSNQEVNNSIEQEKDGSPRKIKTKTSLSPPIHFEANFYSQNVDSNTQYESTVSKVVEDGNKECNISKQILDEKLIHSKKMAPDDKFVTYNLWTFIDSTNEEKANMLMKVQQKKLIVLIRNKIDGFIQNEDGICDAVIVVPKLEYQAEYGAECPSLSETTRNFCSLIFRPNTSLLRVRIDPASSRVLKCETKSLDNIIQESKRVHKHHPAIHLSRLFRLLDMMSSHLSQGNYIFKHNKAMEGYATIYSTASRTEMNPFDLHQFYDKLNLTPSLLQQFPWNPIDPFLITEVHEATNTVPCLFKLNCDNPVKNWSVHKKVFKPKVLNKSKVVQKRLTKPKKKPKNKSKDCFRKEEKGINLKPFLGLS